MQSLPEEIITILENDLLFDICIDNLEKHLNETMVSGNLRDVFAEKELGEEKLLVIANLFSI